MARSSGAPAPPRVPRGYRSAGTVTWIETVVVGCHDTPHSAYRGEMAHRALAHRAAARARVTGSPSRPGQHDDARVDMDQVTVCGPARDRAGTAGGGDLVAGRGPVGQQRGEFVHGARSWPPVHPSRWTPVDRASGEPLRPGTGARTVSTGSTTTTGRRRRVLRARSAGAEILNACAHSPPNGLPSAPPLSPTAQRPAGPRRCHSRRCWSAAGCCTWSTWAGTGGATRSTRALPRRAPRAGRRCSSAPRMPRTRSPWTSPRPRCG